MSVLENVAERFFSQSFIHQLTLCVGWRQSGIKNNDKDEIILFVSVMISTVWLCERLDWSSVIYN